LAAEVGYCLASENRKSSQKVAVIDLNFQDSSLADLLDLEPRLNVSELIDRPERLDDRLIDIFTSRHSPNFDVFSGPTLFDGRQKAYSGVVFPLLDALSKRYDLVLIDLPHHWSPWVDNVIQGSDGLVITGGSAVPAVKQLLMRLKHVESLEVPQEQIKVVVNKCDVTLIGKVRRKQDIDRVLSRGEPLYIPRDSATANEAANSGRPMLEIAPRRPVSKSIRGLAHWVRAVTSQPSRSANKP
jgi:pilus assembly protein CpaE